MAAGPMVSKNSIRLETRRVTGANGD